MARLPRGSRARGTVFVVTFVVVVAGVTGVPAVIGPDAGDHAEYDVEALVPERAESTGQPSVERGETGGVVLIDTAHFNRFDPAEIEPLLGAITAAGYEVDLLELDESLDRSLSDADAYVVIDPGRRYTEAEAARIETFVDRGGRLALLGEPTQSQLSGVGIVTRTSQMSPLSSRFGLEFGEAHLYNMRENDGNHLNVFASPDGPSTLGTEVSRAALYTATTVEVRDGRAVLYAGDGTRSARTDASGRYPVAAVNGNVLAIGDSTFLRHGNYQVVDNDRLVSNLVAFLIGGDRVHTLADYPAFVSENPTIHYTGPALLPGAQEIARDRRADGQQPTMLLQRRPGPNRTDVLVTTFEFLGNRGPQGTGIRGGGGRVLVAGYESDARGIVVARAPTSGYDLIIAADTPERARQGAAMVVQGSIDDYLVTERTAVFRTSAAVRLVSGDGGGDTNRTDGGPD